MNKLPDLALNDRVTQNPYVSKMMNAIKSNGYLVGTVKISGIPVFVIGGTFGPAEYLAMQKEALLMRVPEDMIFVFCRDTIVQGRGVKTMRMRDIPGFATAEYLYSQGQITEQEAPSNDVVVLDAAPLETAPRHQILEQAAVDKELFAMGLIPTASYIERTYGVDWKLGSDKPGPAPADSTIAVVASMLEKQSTTILTALAAKQAPIELTLKSEPTSVVVQMPEQAATVVHITNEVPAAQVVVASPVRSVAEVQRDPQTQEILRTVTTHEMGSSAGRSV